MGVADVAEAVKHFAGVQVRDYGGIGGLKTVGVRGLGAMHTGVSNRTAGRYICQRTPIRLSSNTQY